MDRFRGHGVGVGSLQSPVIPPPTSSARQQGPRLCTSRVCTCVSTPNRRLANCLCHCTSVHRPCTSLQCGIVWQTASVTVRLYTDLVLLFSAALSGKLPLLLYIRTQTLHFFFSAALSGKLPFSMYICTQTLYFSTEWQLRTGLWFAV